MEICLREFVCERLCVSAWVSELVSVSVCKCEDACACVFFKCI